MSFDGLANIINLFQNHLPRFFLLIFISLVHLFLFARMGLFWFFIINGKVLAAEKSRSFIPICEILPWIKLTFNHKSILEQKNYQKKKYWNQCGCLCVGIMLHWNFQQVNVVTQYSTNRNNKNGDAVRVYIGPVESEQLWTCFISLLLPWHLLAKPVPLDLYSKEMTALNSTTGNSFFLFTTSLHNNNMYGPEFRWVFDRNQVVKPPL